MSIDAGVRVAKSEGAIEKILLNGIEQVGSSPNEFRTREERFGRRFAGISEPGYSEAVAAADGDLAALEIARAELDPQGHAFLDPFPVLHAAAEIALVDVHFERRAVPDDWRAAAAASSCAALRTASRVSGFGVTGR